MPPGWIQRGPALSWEVFPLRAFGACVLTSSNHLAASPRLWCTSCHSASHQSGSDGASKAEGRQWCSRAVWDPLSSPFLQWDHFLRGWAVLQQVQRFFPRSLASLGFMAHEWHSLFLSMFFPSLYSLVIYWHHLLLLISSIIFFLFFLLMLSFLYFSVFLSLASPMHTFHAHNFLSFVHWLTMASLWMLHRNCHGFSFL